MSFDPDQINQEVLAEIDALLLQAVNKVEPLTGRKQCGECGAISRVSSLNTETFRAFSNALNNGRQSVTAARRRLASGYFV